MDNIWLHDDDSGAGLPHQAIPANHEVNGSGQAIDKAAGKLAYGETRAPVDVDTLRDPECPVCGNDESFQGDTCQQCGFVQPPKMFQDPDLQKARLLDLRANPATGEANNTDPNLGDPNAMDPNAQGDMVGMEAGQVPDQNGVIEGEVQGLDDAAAPLDSSQIDPDGQPIDPAAAEGRVMQGGEPFTQGPNAPTPQQFMDPNSPEAQDDTPIDPADLEAEEDEEDAENGIPTASDGQQFAPGAGADAGEVGYPGDGVPDLMCPACGFESDAASPLATSTDMNAPNANPDGMQAGDVCPQCQSAQLVSAGEVEQMEAQVPPQAAV
jgi:hypothetical protein